MAIGIGPMISTMAQGAVQAMSSPGFGTLMASGFQAWQQYEAGEQAKAMYDAQAKEVANETAYAARMAVEAQKDLHREGRSAVSEARTMAGKRGLAVGGSAITMTEAITRNVERRKAMIGLEFSETARRNEWLRKQYKFAGESARKTGQIKAFESLLVGGNQYAKYQYGMGNWNPWS